MQNEVNMFGHETGQTVIFSDTVFFVILENLSLILLIMIQIYEPLSSSQGIAVEKFFDLVETFCYKYVRKKFWI